MSWLGLWWRQSDHFDQLGSLLQSRGMAVRTRATVALIGAALTVVVLATIWSGTGPRGPVQLACALAASGGATLGAMLWVLRWPTRRQAMGFAMLSTASIALAALAQSDPVAAMLACTTFATMAGYIALFHAARLMVFNFTIAALTGGVEVMRITAASGVVAAVCGYAVVLTLNLAVPFGIQAVAHVLGTDAVQAERDQLTGLLNRRAFHRRTRGHLRHDGFRPAHLVLTVIDLDRFKQINDKYGHSKGDEALVAVARALRENTDDTAIVGRSGGEEFVIAAIWHPAEIGPRAQRLCDAIAALPFKLTASVGTASVCLDGQEPDTDELVVSLIAAADAAMYAAKRHGGNQIHHHAGYRRNEVSA
ncbi:MAG: GGDEF domain-containing protein [Mycobacterium sp.]|uniref:GGDEF domain-containing protein n=1 Tax=Mycobacterium sp. TaxID=1785 RepID=UPI001ED636F8|nr:GGDEF domain-containing protein [Mycobacterium sp.]MBW0017510.1 GGDEF domain-containing protein [Mycobacterium sp.]